MIVAIDFDHTLTDDSGDPYLPGGETPNEEMIAFAKFLKEEKHYGIVVWTARPWEQAQHIAGKCIQWGVPFNGVMCGKGGADAYVDDKAVNHTFSGWGDKFTDLETEYEKAQAGVLTE